MNRSAAAITVIAACAVSASLGYWFGVRQAWSLGVAADFLPRGSIATYQLGLLRESQPDNVIVGLEADVDNGLIWAYEILQHPMRELWQPLWGLQVYPEYEKYVARMARYRKDHPSPFKPDAFDAVPPGQEQHRSSMQISRKGHGRTKLRLMQWSRGMPQRTN